MMTITHVLVGLSAAACAGLALALGWQWAKGLGDPWASWADWVPVLRRPDDDGRRAECASCRPGGLRLGRAPDWSRVPGLRQLHGQALLDAADEQLAALRQERAAWAARLGRRGSPRTVRQ